MSFFGRAHRPPAGELDVDRIRSHFDFVRAGRVVTNNAASTQPSRELVELYRGLVPWYDNVHRGQSTASRRTTELFETSYDIIAGWLNAPSRRNIATFRNTTEAHNAVMYSLLTEFRDGDNVVTTTLEHNSNFVPWYGLCHEILPRFGRRVECRVARFAGPAGLLDMDHCATLAHRALGLDPPASSRLSFYLYNTVEDVDRAAHALARIATRRVTQARRPYGVARPT